MNLNSFLDRGSSEACDNDGQASWPPMRGAAASNTERAFPSIQEATAAVNSPAGFRILIVDDDEALARLMQFWLEHLGFAVTVAHTGERAYQILANHRFHLALLDVDLPDTTGFEICLWVREQPPLTSLPVIFCTGHDPVAIAERARALDAGILPKPFDLKQLTVRVQAVAAERPNLIPPV